MFNQALFLTILSVAAAGPAIIPNVGQANPPVNPAVNPPAYAPQVNVPVNQVNQPQVNANQVNQGGINQINQINAEGAIQGPTTAQCNVQGNSFIKLKSCSRASSRLWIPWYYNQ